MEKYLKPTSIIDSDNESIREKAQELTQKHDDDIDKAKALFYFVRDEFKYNPYVPKHLAEHFRASNSFTRGEGYCVQKAVLLVTLARAVGIPARLGFAVIRNNLMPRKLYQIRRTNVFPWHGYAELYLRGKWVKAASDFDLKMCRKNGLIPVEFDGRNDAKLHLHDQEGKLHIEYLMDCGPFDDFPLDQIRKVLMERNELA